VSSEFISQDPLGFAGGDTNLYRRAGNSPANATDPSGMIVETGWDAFSLGVGLVSLGYNLRYGTWKDVGYDVLGIVADVGATLLPGVPGGAGVAIRATRLGARAADAVAASATLQRSIKAVQLANLGANTIQGVESGVNAYDAYQDGRYTEAVFNGIGAGFAGLHLGTSAAGSAGRAARALGGGFSAGFSETLGRQGARLYSAGGAAASGIEATANGIRRGVQNLAPVSGVTRTRQQILEGFQDHHIVSDKNVLTKNHELLDLAGFDLQSRTNKIFLPTEASLHPTRSIHLGRHRTSVSRNLAEQMDQIVEVGKQNGFTQEQYLKALRSMISEERQLLRSGERALNKNMRPGAK
jgi:hypothetical protein